MSPFDSLLGNDLIKHHLLRMVKKNALPNSLLFAGPDGVGKGLFAKALAAHVLGQEQHPDLHQYYPEGKIGLHSIHSMRRFSEEVYMAPFNAKRKFFIIHDAERMWPYGANALLKTFEEPPEDTIIILISSMPEVILPTILSRCCTLRFQSLLESDIITILQNNFGQSKEEAEKWAGRAQGSAGKAVMLFKEGGNEIRKMILQLLAKGKMNDYCLLSRELEPIAKKIEEMKNKVEDTCRNEGLTSPAEYLTALQLDSLEKEFEGAAVMKMKQDMRSLFDVILSWFRDIQLMRVDGNRKYLIHADFENEMEQALQRGEILPLERVQEAISKAILSLERSVSLNLCLETLFLKLVF